MFVVDSLMISGLRWVLDTIRTAVDAELNDDTALREQLLAAGMRLEAGEITAEEYAQVEADILARIREIRGQREGSGPLAFASPSEGEPAGRVTVEASVQGDYHGEPPRAHDPPAARASRPAPRAGARRSAPVTRRSRPTRPAGGRSNDR
jgi:hypothetical protein